MEDFSREDRGIFQGIKVPFCLNAIILAFMAYVIFIAGSRVLGWVTADRVAYEKVVYSAASAVTQKLPVLHRPVHEVVLTYSSADYSELWRAWEDYAKENPGSEFEEFQRPQWWKCIIFALWFVFVWSFFAGAINRTAAYRIARDESITLREGLNFGAQTWSNHFLAILFIVIFLLAAFFLCALGGLICQIPFVGELLLIIFFIFILVGAFLITLLLAGLLFGFNMISSAIGVDRVDSFDAISRAYSYILGRPWQTLLYTVLPLLFVTFFLYFGRIFQDVALGAVYAGMGEKFTPIYQYAAQGIPKASAFANQPWTMFVSGLLIKIFIWLANLFIISTAIAYWLSARTKAYFLLRKEVDGDEVEEMYLEEEEEALEAPEAAPAAPPAREEKKEKPEKPDKPGDKKYTEKELNDLQMDELRAIGEKYDLKGRSKKKLIERILKAQEK